MPYANSAGGAGLVAAEALPAMERRNPVAIIAHIHDANEHDIGYVCGFGPSYYVARIHRAGARTYEVVSRHRTELAAFAAMAAAVSKGRKTGYPPVNRGDVLMVEKGMSYYDPISICELRV